MGHYEFFAVKGQGVPSSVAAESLSGIVGKICHSGSVVCYVAVVAGGGISLAAGADIVDWLVFLRLFRRISVAWGYLLWCEHCKCFSAKTLRRVGLRLFCCLRGGGFTIVPVN